MEEKKVLLLEGLLPMDVWNTIIVLLALFGVGIAVFKGVILIRDEIENHKKKKNINKKDVTDEIADKVMEQLTPKIDEKFRSFEEKFDERIADIDSKLATDKANIDSHTKQLNDHESRVGKLEGANYSLCHGMLALLERDPALAKEQKAMKNYLIDGKYNEEDWK